MATILPMTGELSNPAAAPRTSCHVSPAMTSRDDEAAGFLRYHWQRQPQIAIVLGTGMHCLSREMAIEAEFPYAEVPGFPRSTAPGHRGRLLCGTLPEWGNLPAVMLDGRWHLYEGYSVDEVTAAIRALARLGTDTLVLLNAAGGLNFRLRVGDLVIVDDHLNFHFQTPAIAWSGATRGPCFARPVYDLELAQRASDAACRLKIPAHRGIYAAMLGPTYETRAEYRMLRQLGADVVGMSTVPEALIAAHLGMRVLAISTVTNVPFVDHGGHTSGDAVLEAAREAQPRVSRLLRDVLPAAK